MKRIKRLGLMASTISLVVLAGCASTTEMGIATLNQGNLDAAERLFTRAIQEGDPYAWNNLGVVHQRRGNLDLAIKYYTIAARYGVPVAQQNLIQLGQPVPPVDLRVASAPQDSSLLLQALMVGAAGYQQGRAAGRTQAQPAPAPAPAPAAPVNCTTKQNPITKVWDTVCK